MTIAWPCKTSASFRGATKNYQDATFGCPLSAQAFYDERMQDMEFVRERFYTLSVKQGIPKKKVEKRLAQDKAREFQEPCGDHDTFSYHCTW